MDQSPFGKTIAIVLVVVLVFLFPLPYIAKAVNMTIDDLVNTNMTEFTDEARQQGKITKEMYENMIRELDRTGELYDVDIEVSHPVSGTETAEIELGDEIPDEGITNASYIANETFLDEIYEEGLNNHEEEIVSFSTNVHTMDCYAGHRHDDNCALAGNMSANIEINAYSSDYGNGKEIVQLYLTCSSCNKLIYQIYYAAYPEYNNFQYNSIYTGVNPDGTAYTTTQTRNIPYGDAAISEQIKNAIKPFVNKFLTYNNTNLTNMPETIFPVIDNNGNVTTKPYVGCANCLEFTGPAISGSVSYYSGDWMYGTRSVERSLNHYEGSHPFATITYRESGGSNINHWSNECIYFRQLYLKGNGDIGQKAGKAVNRFLTMPGTGPNPGPEWTKVYTTVNFGGGDEIINEYRKPNPEWNTAYNRYINADFAWFGYDSKYSCPWCLASGSLPKSFSKVLSCGQEQDETPVCNQVVTSIISTNPNQTVNKGSNIVTTATASYLDGHTGTVNCTSNFNPNQLGPQTVTLTYNGLVDNAKTTGSKTCTVNVTVKDPFKLSSLTVSPTSQEVFRYQSPSFSVTANYDNGTSKQVTGYSISTYNSSTLGTQTVIITYTETDVTKTASVNVTVKNLTTVCSVCNTVYYLDNNDTDQGCPNCNSTIIGITASPDNVVLHQGEPLDITVEAEYANGKRSVISGWTSNYDSTQVGIQEVTVKYQTFTAVIIVDVSYTLKTCNICSLEYELNNDGTDPGCPACSKTVMSIVASPKELTIDKHQSLPITVTATYKDGHTEAVNDWASNLLADTAGIYEVMILYKNVIDLIKVTVLEDGQIECPYCGLKYIFNDSPKGCPSCYVTLTSIEASLRSGGIKVPYKSKLNLQITKIFKDEHRELTYTGWTVSDYDPGRLGNQTITAHYNGFTDQLNIEVVDDLPELTCPNGHTYYLNEDGSDPGCPYCNATESKAEALFLFHTTYTNIILDEIYMHGEFKLEEGDYLKVTIRPRKVSIISKLLSIFNGFIQNEYTFGGEVS